MNKFCKYFFLLTVSCGMCMSAVGADVSERTDCDSIQARINELSAIETPSESQTSELETLQMQYRNNCSKPASGRRTTVSRVSASTVSATTTSAAPVVPVVETVIMTTKTVLNDYINERKNLCDEFKSNMDTLLANGATDEEMKPLQNQYDADCAIDIDKSEVVEIDAETAAANVAAGLCTDGSKPNQFGCCKGETFKDMGNLVFACCPDDGGECYPPITSGN